MLPMSTTETTTQTAADLTAVVDAYVRCFNETDPAARLDLARQVFAEDGRLADPLVDATGPEAIADAIGGLQAQMPGHTLTRTSAVDGHHDVARMTWAVAGPDGQLALAGHELMVVAPDGRLARSIGFFGDVEALA